MNTTELEGNWNELKGKLKQKFATLTDDDLLFAEGKKDEMMGKLEKKLGKSKEDLHKIISEYYGLKMLQYFQKNLHIYCFVIFFK